jgi:hypothetical protein
MVYLMKRRGARGSEGIIAKHRLPLVLRAVT